MAHRPHAEPTRLARDKAARLRPSLPRLARDKKLHVSSLLPGALLSLLTTLHAHPRRVRFLPRRATPPLEPRAITASVAHRPHRGSCGLARGGGRRRVRVRGRSARGGNLRRGELRLGNVPLHAGAAEGFHGVVVAFGSCHRRGYALDGETLRIDVLVRHCDEKMGGAV